MALIRDTISHGPLKLKLLTLVKSTLVDFVEILNSLITFMNKFRNSRVAKITSGFVGVMTAVMMMGGVAVLPASAQTVEELQALINSLLSQIQALQAQINTAGGSSAAPSGLSGYVFTRDLTDGSTGDDVMKLQKYLNSSADTQLASSGAGSP